MPEKVIELSVEESNELRARLGLKPLRADDGRGKRGFERGASGGGTNGREVLEMSVDATNALRAKLGLKPLKGAAGAAADAVGDGRGQDESRREVHKPAANERADREATERIERAKLQRQVEQGIADTFGTSTLASGDDNALSWAAQMRKNSARRNERQDTVGRKTKKKSRKKAEQGKPAQGGQSHAPSEYQEQDLAGIQVGHSVGDLEAGSTTILTLKDESLLADQDDSDKTPVLENAQIRESKQQKKGLALKRQLELGMGRAGGYAGFDDDEFEELGGTLGPSRTARGARIGIAQDEQERAEGFVLGQHYNNQAKDGISDFDAIQQGRAISLVSDKADTAANDYMTVEEQEAERQSRKKKKDGTFKKQSKKKKKKLKKDKKNRRRANQSDDDDDDDRDEVVVKRPTRKTKKSIADELEESAVDDTNDRRKRRRTEDNSNEATTPAGNRTKRFEDIMEKGNDRTRAAFQKAPPVDQDEEPDDSFLNAALAKARRLNMLRNMKQKRSTGADAVVEAVKSSSVESHPIAGTSPTASGSGKTMTFSTDDTREFTRALQARTAQTSRTTPNKKGTSIVDVAAPKSNKTQPKDAAVKQERGSGTSPETVNDDIDNDNDNDVTMDIDQLAKEVKDDEPDPSLQQEEGVGRGLSSFISMLKNTGELSNKRTIGEELRGRAKDERNYDNYKPLELNKIVKIGANATDKDQEFAEREIKLEYRDKHGRLLTSKEAYRELCYQFHGHRSGKKNEEKRLRRIAMEQAEARMASKSMAAARDGAAAGTLGALKATQKATGKAFLVHKL